MSCQASWFRDNPEIMTRYGVVVLGHGITQWLRRVEAVLSGNDMIVGHSDLDFMLL